MSRPAQGWRSRGAYRPGYFAVGSFLTFVKELVRLVTVEKTVRGTSHLFRGIKDGRVIAADASFRPMPPLEPVGGEKAA